MTKEKMDRISFLARKQKTEGLTEAEKAEQTELRNEYRAAVVGNLRASLECIEIEDENGKYKPLGKKGS